MEGLEYILKNSWILEKESYEKDMLSTINTAKKIAQELKIELSKNPELMKSREDVFVFADEEEKVEIHIGLLGMHPFLAKSAVPFCNKSVKAFIMK